MRIAQTDRKKGELNLPLIYGFIAAGSSIFALFLLYLKKVPMIPCIFKEITGYPCPTCGATRLVLSSFELDFMTAFKYNPLLFVAGIIFSVWVMYGFFMFFTGKKICVKLSEKEGIVLKAVIVFLVFLNWIYLLVSGI